MSGGHPGSAAGAVVVDVTATVSQGAEVQQEEQGAIPVVEQPVVAPTSPLGGLH